MTGFAEKLNIQRDENSTQIVYIICVRNVWICIEIECPEQRKFYGKLYSLYIRNTLICRKTYFPEQRKFNGKLCTFYMYGMSGLAKKLSIQNYVYSMENCVRYIRTECLYLQRN